MKKRALPVVSSILMLLLIMPLAGAEYKGTIIDQIRLAVNDIPQGLVYGSIPPFAQRVLRENPWKFDRAAIKRLTKEIYPDGDPDRVADIHMTILTRPATPFGDDIVCYIIVYNNMTSAKNEIKKITDFVGYNSDRAIVSVRENIVVFLHADDIDDFPVIREMMKKIGERLDNL
ncbi:MAG TPA: hypothetical protein VLM75_06920 [Spirochaetota bacterium]|nr:hypothetical protein [Spirochaetota bacterium]